MDLQKAKEEKELMQELGMVQITPDLRGIKNKLNGKEVIIPVSQNPARIVTDEYEEPREIYKERRRLMKHMEKQGKKGTQMWDSRTMGTYKKKTEDEVRKEYEKITSKGTSEDRGKALEKIVKKRRNARI